MNCIKRLGERVMSRTFERQVNELHIRAAILNRFTELGCPQTRLDDLASQRDAVVAAIKRGAQAKARPTAAPKPAAEPEDFVEEQGGVY